MGDTLGSLKLEVQELIGDPDGDSFSDAALTRRINRAYGLVIAELDRIKQPWNTIGPIALAVSPGVQEITLSGTILQHARKLVDPALREYGNGQGHEPLSIGNLQARLRGTSGVPWLRLDQPQQTPLYCYRKIPEDVTGASPFWVLGLTDVPSESFTLLLWGLPAIEDYVLENEADEPVLLPPEWHTLVALKAAIACKVIENRDPQGLLLIYAEELARISATASRVVTSSRSIPN